MIILTKCFNKKTTKSKNNQNGAVEVYDILTRGGYRNSKTIDNGVISRYNNGVVSFEEPHVVDVGKNIELLGDGNSLNKPMNPKNLSKGLDNSKNIFNSQANGYSGVEMSEKDGKLAAQAVNTVRLSRKIKNKK